jgi:hypothetical protein
MGQQIVITFCSIRFHENLCSIFFMFQLWFKDKERVTETSALQYCIVLYNRLFQLLQHTQYCKFATSITWNFIVFEWKWSSYRYFYKAWWWCLVKAKTCCIIYIKITAKYSCKWLVPFLSLSVQHFWSCFMFTHGQSSFNKPTAGLKTPEN